MEFIKWIGENTDLQSVVMIQKTDQYSGKASLMQWQNNGGRMMPYFSNEIWDKFDKQLEACMRPEPPKKKIKVRATIDIRNDIYRLRKKMKRSTVTAKELEWMERELKAFKAELKENVRDKKCQ